MGLDIDDWRQRIGRVGVWLPGTALRSPDLAATAVELDRMGFGTLWLGGGNPDREAFATLASLLEGTQRLLVATGIANIWAWEPAAMEEAAAAIEAKHRGRFLLGLGVSHPPLVSGLGKTYRRPLTTMREFLHGLDDAASRAERPSPFRVLAALKRGMLEVARDESAGAHPYFVPVRHTAIARGVLGAGPLLVPEQGAVLDADPERARAAARNHTVRYLRMPNYTRNLRELGFGEEDLAGAGSDRLVDSIVAWGDAAAIAARVREHLDVGADQVAIQPLGGAATWLDMLRRLEPELAGLLAPARQ